MTAAVCCSYAFMLPVATAPNAIVFSHSTMKTSGTTLNQSLMQITIGKKLKHFGTLKRLNTLFIQFKKKMESRICTHNFMILGPYKKFLICSEANK